MCVSTLHLQLFFSSCIFEKKRGWWKLYECVCVCVCVCVYYTYNFVFAQLHIREEARVVEVASAFSSGDTVHLYAYAFSSVF